MSESRPGFFVLFPSGACDIAAAADALSAMRFTVTTGHGELTATRQGAQRFHVVMNAEEYVVLEAGEISERASIPAIASCDARFEVSFDDLEAALDEYTTLFDIQVTLLEATKGYVYLQWNDNVLPVA
jgi:hypothetical protein